jgi:hypothetical protein
VSGISETIAILSLNLTLALVNAGQVARTFPVTGASATTPIEISSPGHGVPLGRVVHGVVSGIQGTVEANGLGVLTPTDGDTFALSTFTAQGIYSPSVGVHAYTSGGQIQVAFPDYAMLLGRRNLALSSAVASPRIVWIPTEGRAWDFVPYGGQGPAPKQERGSVEQQSEALQPNLGTKHHTFEVTITGAANPPSPDFGDFDAVDAIQDQLFAVLFDTLTPPIFRVLHESWPSQSIDAGSQTQRGQQCVLTIEIVTPIARPLPGQFVPVGTSLVFVVEAEDPQTSADEVTFTVNPTPAEET